jgi:hypothetical protein
MTINTYTPVADNVCLHPSPIAAQAKELIPHPVNAKSMVSTFLEAQSFQEGKVIHRIWYDLMIK